MTADFELLMELYREDPDLFIPAARRWLSVGNHPPDEAARIARLLPSVLPAPKDLAQANQLLCRLILELTKRIHPECTDEMLRERISGDTGILSDRLTKILDGHSWSSREADALDRAAEELLKQSRLSPTANP